MHHTTKAHPIGKFYTTNWHVDFNKNVFDNRRMIKTIRERIIEGMTRTGISAAELARQADVSYNVVTKLRHRPDSSTSAENAERLLAVLYKLAPDLNHDASHSLQGMAEPDIAPWVPKDARQAETILSLLAPRAQHPAAYLLNMPISQYYFAARDILIVDLKAPAKNGDIVIASKIDPDTGSAETLIGRLVNPHIIPPDAHQTPWVIDGTITIRGPIVSSFRNPEI
jgi:hypothetical protein